MTMITPSYLGETIEYSSLHACRSTLEDPTSPDRLDALVWAVTELTDNFQAQAWIEYMRRHAEAAGVPDQPEPEAAANAPEDPVVARQRARNAAHRAHR